MKEAAFSKQIRDDLSFVYSRCHIYLIQDSYRTGRKPYDFYVVHKNHFTAVECKSINGKSLNLSCVTDRQVSSLREAYFSGTCARAFVFIYSDYLKKVLVFSLINWVEMIKDYGKKSVKFDILATGDNIYVDGILTRNRRNGKTRWDVETVVH